MCIMAEWLCDQDPDCTDKSDEKNCGANYCHDEEFNCTNGVCINKSWRYDGDYDCKDMSDEQNCNRTNNGKPRCKQDEFECASGKCIQKLWVCDEDDDCSDNSDEANCNTTVPQIFKRPVNYILTMSESLFSLSSIFSSSRIYFLFLQNLFSLPPESIVPLPLQYLFSLYLSLSSLSISLSLSLSLISLCLLSILCDLSQVSKHLNSWTEYLEKSYFPLHFGGVGLSSRLAAKKSSHKFIFSLFLLNLADYTLCINLKIRCILKIIT